MFAKIIDYLGDRFTSVAFAMGVLVFIWLCGWLANGLIGTKLDLAALRELFLFILGKFGVDSIWNSPKGAPPGQKNGGE
jgi:hypothetical protein